MFQLFWRCAHNPSAIDNFFAKQFTCICGCHMHPPKWWSNGMWGAK